MAQPSYRNIEVQTNFGRIVQLPSHDYFQYSAITPTPGGRPPNLIMKNKLFHHLQDSVDPSTFNPKMLYDRQSIAHCSRRLVFVNGSSGGTFVVHLNIKGQAPEGMKGAYVITIALTNAESVRADHTQDITHRYTATSRAIVATNLLQAIVRQKSNQLTSALRKHFISNSKAYFDLEEKQDQRDTGKGYQLLMGIYMAVKPADNHMLLTIDTTTAAVYSEMPLVQFCLNTVNARDTRALVLDRHSPSFKKLEHVLAGVRIFINYGNGPSRKENSKEKKIRALEPRAGTFSFAKDDHTEMTVASYFESTYNRKLLYPDIIGINLSGKNSDKKIIVPLELCRIVPGQLCRKIPDDIKALMVRFSTKQPFERLNRIQKELGSLQKASHFQEHGLRVSPNLLSVNGKSFFPPQLVFDPEKRSESVSRGKWNVQGKRFTDPQRLMSWGVLNLCGSILTTDEVKKHMEFFRMCCTSLGMIMPETPSRYLEAQPHNVLPVLNQHPNVESHPQSTVNSRPAYVLFIFLPNEASSARAEIKYWGDCSRGIITQCLRLNKVQKATATGDDQYWNNVALKVNARLGGTNFLTKDGIIDWMQKKGPYMIIGADVGHPSPGVRKPSVTGLVYSLDRNATRYAAFTGIQAPRQEIIEDLKDFVKKAIVHFTDENKIAPAAIFFFRDGVSDGEYDAVRREEIPKIEEAIQEFKKEVNKPNYQMNLTFMVVTKRHHAVFFGTDRQNRTINCDPGLVVDSQITNPTERDFYLQSHQAIQGTSRSSHYIVLKDDCFNYDASLLQRLSFDLCHVYAKATRSVSIPAPVYYADLVCSRLMFHIGPDAGVAHSDDGQSTASGGNGAFDISVWRDRRMASRQRSEQQATAKISEEHDAQTFACLP